MLYSEIIAVCSQIHTKPTNTLCGQKVELLSVKHDGTYIYHWTLIMVNIQFMYRSQSHICMCGVHKGCIHS
jgi:hypothetical protein